MRRRFFSETASDTSVTAKFRLCANIRLDPIKAKMTIKLIASSSAQYKDEFNARAATLTTIKSNTDATNTFNAVAYILVIWADNLTIEFIITASCCPVEPPVSENRRFLLFTSKLRLLRADQ